jgi:hypothetical protein
LLVAEAGGGFVNVKSKPPTGTVTPPKANAVGGANAGDGTGLLQKLIIGGFLVLESPLTLVAITPPKANAAGGADDIEDDDDDAGFPPKLNLYAGSDLPLATIPLLPR